MSDSDQEDMVVLHNLPKVIIAKLWWTFPFSKTPDADFLIWPLYYYFSSLLLTSLSFSQ